MMTTMMRIMRIGIDLVYVIKNMGKHKNRNKHPFYLQSENESLDIVLDDTKFAVIQDNVGEYSILNFTGGNKIIVKQVKDDNDEYARNCIMEILEYLQRKI